MDVTAVCERVRAVASVRGDASADRSGLEAGLRSIGVLRSWLAAVEADLAGRLVGVVSFPEKAIADAGRSSLGQAGRVLERSTTLGATPELASGLDHGSVTAGHIDAVTKVAKSLEGSQRDELLARANRLVGFAAIEPVAEFRRRLEQEAKALQADDGMDRFERQKSAARLRRWTDADGMWCLQGRFDPLTGVRMNARLSAEIDALFAESVPAGCPSDPVAKQEFLAAWALAGILERGDVAQRAGRPEFIVVIEADANRDESGDGSAEPASAGPTPAGPPASGRGSGRPTVDWGLPVEVPYRVLAELFAVAEQHVVVVRDGVVLYAPGELNLGRSTRLASSAQRRALRALYATCAVPGCGTRFERCKIHHVVWWRHGGNTDLANLLPVCVHHHTMIHDHGWELTLGQGRELTLRLPDGTLHNTGPPRRRAA
ncbi:MAG: HNH endonuclease signature motif containing protein [Actinomycetota bacterium]|nr:HNH endonuclease signature motif containing protein [Actinomycetota bacterium]